MVKSGHHTTLWKESRFILIWHIDKEKNLTLSLELWELPMDRRCFPIERAQIPYMNEDIPFDWFGEMKGPKTKIVDLFDLTKDTHKLVLDTAYKMISKHQDSFDWFDMAIRNLPE
jgi:hypothetical protein